MPSDSLRGQSEPRYAYLSICVITEPIFGPDEVQWRGMAFVGGSIVNNITGSDRAAVFEDCVDAAGLALSEADPISQTRADNTGHNRAASQSSSHEEDGR